MASQFDLGTLLDWVRRQASDRLIRNRDVLTTDGTNTVSLSNDGNIILTNVMLNGVTQTAPANFTQDVNIITFAVTPGTGLNVVCVYNRSSYTDSEICQFIIDGANNVVVDLALAGWQLNTSDPLHPLVAYPDQPLVVDFTTVLDENATNPNWIDQTVERLIVLKSAIMIRQDLAAQNADSAIGIRDGDTNIDTAKTAAASEKVVQRLEAQYQQAFRYALANRATGVAIQNNWVPLPYPWSTPNMMPGEVNGPTY